MKLYHEQEAIGIKSGNFSVDFADLEEMARDGLLSLSIQLGIKALQIMLDEEVACHAGRKGKHDPRRNAYRHGFETSSVVLGGQKIPIKKPRGRSKDRQEEIPIETLMQFQREDILNNAIIKRILHGVSTRNYRYTLDEIPAEKVSTSKSSVSRRFIYETGKLLKEFLERRIEEYYPVIMMDGVVLEDI